MADHVIALDTSHDIGVITQGQDDDTHDQGVVGMRDQDMVYVGGGRFHQH